MSRTILVTGGVSGIGRATVDAILAEGWKVVLLDRPGAAFDEVMGTLDPEQATGIAVDVTDEAAVERGIAAIPASFLPLDGVVNSAGIADGTPMLETEVEAFRRVLEVNVIGSFIVARACVRAMRDSGGAIVNIGSVSGMRGNARRTAYGASKGAVVTMSQVMAVELASLGIRVNVIAPGPVETAMVREVHSDEERNAWTSRIPLARYGTPAEIASAAVFLLDPDSSGFVTGQVLCVDGGFMSAGIMPHRPD